MLFQFNINTDAVITYTNKLEKLPRAAFPSAVRGTLNAMAFYVKTKSMPFEASRAFKKRNRNFFRAASKVKQAKGFSVKTMKSEVGFVPFGGKNTAVQELEQQERGGRIKNRSFVPTKDARISKSNLRAVQTKNRMGAIKNIVKVSDAQGSNKSQKFIKSVIFAGVGGFVLTERSLLRVDSIKRVRGSYKFKLTGIYSFEKDRSVKIKATHFMHKASRTAANNGNKFFELEAKRQFGKYLKI